MYSKILLFSILLWSMAGMAQNSFDYCQNEFPDLSPVTNVYFPEELCVSMSGLNLNQGCNADMLIQELPFSWYSDQTDTDTWHFDNLENEIITLDFDFQFSGVSTTNTYPVDNQITIEYRGSTEFLLLNWDQVGNRFHGTYSFNVGTADFDGPQGHPLVINFWAFGGPDTDIILLNAGTKIMVNSAKKLESDPLWVTSSPQAPQLILRDPPGDGSYSSFSSEDEICHGYGMSTLP